jgi:dynein heavy chain, axonemal
MLTAPMPVQDLFPDLCLPEHANPELLDAVNGAACAQQLQPVPSLSIKCLQLHDTFAVRFGVMLVGGASAGKTSTYATLRCAYNSLATGSHPMCLPVKCHILNPKAVTLGQLYGEYNSLTGEWKDGLASSFCREAAKAPTSAMQWIVFDGPVDALWIESMNTVLDDNCTLCLPSGERMRLSPVHMRMLFEVDDLSAASPATVSRCGMVYVPQSITVPPAIDPLVQSWLERLPSVLAVCLKAPDERPGCCKECTARLSQEMVSDLAAMFSCYLPAGVAWLAANASESVPATERQRLSALCTWLQALLHSGGAWDYREEYGPADKVALGYIFAFAYVWGLGGSLNGPGRDGWDAMVRELFAGVANFPAGSGTVYDFCCDPDRNYTFQACPPQCCWHAGASFPCSQRVQEL